MGAVIPLASLETEQKVESIRCAICWHWGHEAPSLAWLRGRNSSNFKSQSGHTYSYIGISLHLFQFILFSTSESSFPDYLTIDNRHLHPDVLYPLWRRLNRVIAQYYNIRQLALRN